MSINERFDFEQPVSAKSLKALVTAQPGVQHFQRNVLNWLGKQIPAEEELEAAVEALSPVAEIRGTEEIVPGAGS